MIRLPKRFEKILATDALLNSAVRQTFDRFEPWLEQSGMPFFPGFTDHSPRHIGDVLNTAASLISDASYELLNAPDIAVLCIAALLHDCGMHLTTDGFRTLIEDSGTPPVSGLADRPWAQLWTDYLAETRRFGQDKLLAIFGDAEPVCVDEINYEDLSERDFLLIGEFIRRHHPRLAHEIALVGVPSHNVQKLEIVGFDNDLRDIAGLVARSHGMSIRDTFSYLEERYSLIPEQRRIKSPFIMAVLRIADYVQVQSERALKSLLSVKELRSPISKQEWRNHFAVRDVSQWHNDPEAFFVNAAPTDVKTYLKLIKLFLDIQRELDETWATLGEVYGRLGALALLGLTMRRIRSNLDYPEKFAKTVPYIPIKAGFDSSGPDLLKLLVGPLYDYKNEIALRELIQNAVDACRELADYSRDDPKKEANLVTVPDIVVNIEENEDGTGWVTVTDNGVGMTLNTVTNYFLVAGASFRNSDVWKREHIDDSGQTRVMRGGRFGVGALAAFLLGDEIQVRTRHFARPESEGLEFKAHIDSPNIELRRCVASAGTSIKIWVANPNIIDHIRPHLIIDQVGQKKIIDSWRQVDWFVQSSPSIEYRWNGYDYREGSVGRKRYSVSFVSKNEDKVPLPGTSVKDWVSLSNPAQYADIYWRYTPRVNHTNGNSTWTIQPSDQVTVNGIRVQKLAESFLKIQDSFIGTGPAFQIRRPSLAIFDPAGICPINLQRSSIAFERMGIDSLLASSVLDAHFRKVIDDAKSIGTFEALQNYSRLLALSRDVRYQGLLSPICATRDGICLSSTRVFAELKIRTIYFVNLPMRSTKSTKFTDVLRSGEACIFRQAETGTQNDLAWFRGTVSTGVVENIWYSREAGFPLVFNALSVSVLPKAKWEFATEKGRVSQYILKQLTHKSLAGDLVQVVAGDAMAAGNVAKRCLALLKCLGGDAEVTAWTFEVEQSHATTSSLLIDTWLNINQGSFLAASTVA